MGITTFPEFIIMRSDRKTLEMRQTARQFLRIHFQLNYLAIVLQNVKISINFYSFL